MRSGNLLKSEKERPGVKTGASSMPELPVRSVVFGGEEIFGAGDGTGAQGALVGQWRKPGVRRQPLSHAARASSPYTGEPTTPQSRVACQLPIHRGAVALLWATVRLPKKYRVGAALCGGLQKCKIPPQIVRQRNGRGETGKLYYGCKPKEGANFYGYA